MIKTSKFLMPRIVALGAFSLLCLFSLTFANRAIALNARLDFQLHNATGYTITKVFIAPTTTTDWGDDLMGDDVFKDGDDLNITFSPKAKADLWDMKVEYKDGSFHQWTALDLSKITHITLHYNADTNTTTEEHDSLD